jgi:hypothetical protein
MVIALERLLDHTYVAIGRFGGTRTARTGGSLRSRRHSFG